MYLNHNLLTGSLNFLSNMKNLKVLAIGDNDFDEIIDNLPKSLGSFSYGSSRSHCKLNKIIPQLKKFKYGFCQNCFQPNNSNN